MAYEPFDPCTECGSTELYQRVVTPAILDVDEDGNIVDEFADYNDREMTLECNDCGEHLHP